MNRLAHETSPYLRQHADNPVDWYPWGDEAFAAARETDRPILLSVGYSSCHWCHVMAHESFEDPSTAAVMNRRFVSVKVDREERPDVDAIYMQAVQAMTGQGGWPMTVFLAPDGRPLFGGTYFPKEDAHGRPGFVRMLEAVADAWTTRRDDLLEQAAKLHTAIERSLDLSHLGGHQEPGIELLDHAHTAACAQVDPKFGGFGPAPKFPQAMTLDLLLRTYVRTGAPDALAAVQTSLDAMAAGGIHDQLGGGFHRYSVDAFWLVPHFEKMLYDQALLTSAFLHAFLVTGEARYRRVVQDTIGYVLRELRHADGGLFSAEDADSEGVEGKFYLWSLGEIEEVCESDASEVIRYFGVTERGNFEDPHTGYRGSILHTVDRTEAAPAEVERSIPKLFERRARRVRPGLDDKVLLGWNALFLRVLAEAAAAFDPPPAALQAAPPHARFLLDAMRDEHGRLFRSWQDGNARHPAYAEDYGALLEALVTLAEVDDVAWLTDARHIADDLLRLFHDDEQGGFFTTGVDAETLIVRAKNYQDNATPAENSLAASGLLRLAALTGESRYETPGHRVVTLLGPVAAEHPTAFAYLLGAVERSVIPPMEIAIIGDASAPDTSALRHALHSQFLPGAVTLIAAPGVGTALSPLLVDRPLVDGKATAYLCERYACRQPVTEPGELLANLDAVIVGRRG